MKNGMYEDGTRVLRAKIDMASPNINMRDPIIYRVAHMSHHNTGDKWCIYPMYDFAHPIEDAIEGVTHSICTLEFEDHRPLYDWVVNELEYENPPRQIEFAKLYVTNVVTGKRYIKQLVEDGIVDGWDDPRLVSIAALRRRGFTPESIKMFVELCGISKSNSSVDYAMLEYCIREDLKAKKPRLMAVLDPVKVIIDNYPEDKMETAKEKVSDAADMAKDKLNDAKDMVVEKVGEDKIDAAKEKVSEVADMAKDKVSETINKVTANINAKTDFEDDLFEDDVKTEDDVTVEDTDKEDAVDIFEDEDEMDDDFLEDELKDL